MRILYAGPHFRWSTTESRRRALVALGHDVDSLDTSAFLDRGPGLFRKLQRHLQCGPGIVAYNRALVAKARSQTHDVIWLDTGAQVWRSTLRQLRTTGALLVSYNSDYLGYRRYYWRHFMRSVTEFDVHIDTNELNRAMLKQHGARKVVRADPAYDPEIHRPPQTTLRDRAQFESDAVFIGHWEPAYERALSVVRRAGLRLRIWGVNWHRRGPRRRLGTLIQTPNVLWGEDSVKAIAHSKIGIGLLSKWNRNTSTGRSFEIPAIGGFLLAERTADHLAAYEDGIEAVFFCGVDELLDKARYYLAHESERQQIARRGHERCLKSGYTHQDRMKAVLTALS